MFNVRNIISRADELTVQDLLGIQLINLIQGMDSNYRKTSELKKLIFQIHSERSFLDDTNLRKILIDLLKFDEVKLMAETLGFLSSLASDEYEYLKNKRFMPGSVDEQLFYNFFNIKVSNSKNEKDMQDIVSIVEGNYQLFSHQRRAVKEIKEHLNRYPHRVLLHMPTGSGKTRTSMNLICDYLRHTEPTLMIWLASSEELCIQAKEEFNNAWSNLGNRKVTIAELWGKSLINELLNIEDGLIIAGFQKLTNYLNNPEGLKLFSKLAEKISFIVVDEAHQSIAEKYQSIIEILFNSNPTSKLLGLSATPGRTWNNIDEDQKLANFYNRKKVTLKIDGYMNPVDYLVDEQYISEVKYRVLNYDNNEETSQFIHKYRMDKNKDYSKELLSILGRDVNRNIKIISEVIYLSQNHKRLIVFAPSVESSDAIAAVLKVKGYWVNSITSNTNKELRREMIKEFRRNDNRIRILCNYGVLTTGFDSPNTSALIIARPTLSLVLYSQMVGRAIRGPKAGGNKQAEIISVVDKDLPGFGSVAESFQNWEDVWNEHS